MKLLEVNIVSDGGPWAMHNMPCAICLKKKAVLHLDTYVFYPCWSCQKEWKLKKRRMSWWNRIFKNY